MCYFVYKITLVRVAHICSAAAMSEMYWPPRDCLFAIMTDIGEQKVSLSLTIVVPVPQ